MAVGGFADRIAFIIEADPRSAVAAFRKVGEAAEKDLKKADNQLDKIGGRMQVAGAGAVAFGVVAGRALLGFARASEEANRSQLLLQNTIDNQPQLAGESTDAFNELADSIQDVTAADGDAVVAAMAMLGTFRLTGDEIRNVTPLVVDYARKFGVDLTDAAVQVGKALDGQSGALRRNGVSIDLALFATDRYAAVTQALREQVGGFAEEEGKTFSGQLERLKNQLGDVAEGVGVGVVDAFGDMVSAGTGVLNFITGTSAASQAAAGKFAAYGTAAVGAVGSLSFLAGSLVKMSDRFHKIDDVTGRATGKLNLFGKAAGAVALVTLVAGLREMGRAAEEATVDLDEFNRQSLSELDESIRTLAPLWENWTSEAEESFRHLVDQSVPAAERMIESMERQGISTDQARAIVDEKRTMDRLAATDAREYAESIDENTGATDRNSAAIKRNRDAAEQSRRAFERLREARDAATGNAISAERAEINLQRAQQRLAEVNADGESSALDRRDAELGVQEAVISVGEAWERLAEDQAIAAGEGATSVRQAADAEIAALQSVADQLHPDSDLRRFLADYIAQLVWLKENSDIRTSIALEGIAAGDHPGVLSTEGQPRTTRSPTGYGSESFPIPSGKSVVINNYGMTWEEGARQMGRDIAWRIN